MSKVCLSNERRDAVTVDIEKRLRTLTSFPKLEAVEEAVALLSTDDAGRLKAWHSVAFIDFRRTFDQIIENLETLENVHVDDSNLSLFDMVVRTTRSLLDKLSDDLTIAREIVADPGSASNKTRISRALRKT